jgi:tetratricopeptide (TPR) repeat protein/transcriptional regulator with XRE-family HTH domain
MGDDGAGFGGVLRSCRLAARLSQQELAEASGMSVRAISDLERGRARRPYPYSLSRLADGLRLRDRARAEFIAAAGRRLAGDPAASLTAVPGGRPARPVPRQLPGPVRQFTGRERELAALTGLLDRAGSTPAAVVISAIEGTAGVGKTALAVHWAHQVANRFPDGQLYVNLRGYHPGPPMPASDALAGFLRALGVAGQDIPGDADERAAAYRSLLAGRRMLVVLDNAREVAQVRPLLPGSPGCVTVVTSRDALAGLVARDGASRLEVDLLRLPEAVGLLRELIGSRVDDEPAAAVALARQCCRLPLALRIAAELAVARPDGSLSDLATELADLRCRLDVLEAGEDERTAVRAVFSWSYRQLDPGTARAFRLAGLHPGPDLDGYAAAALTGTTLSLVNQHLARLARAHLVQPTGAGRYGLHDLLRCYAREQASGCDGEAIQKAAMTALFDYYLYMAACAMNAAFPGERHRRPPVPPRPATPVPALPGPPTALARLDAELPALAAATGYAAAHDWPGHASGLAATLFRYLDASGHFPEAITIHTSARRAARHTGDQAAEADALIGLGLVHGHQGRHQQATSHFRQALARYRQADDQAGQARALNYLGLVYCQEGDHQRATSNLQQAAALYHTVRDRTGEAYALSNLGMIALRQGRYRQAAGQQQQALALLAAVRDRHGQATVLERLGLLALRQNRHQLATCHLQQALTRYRKVGDQQGQASALAKLGAVNLRQGRPHRATSQLRQALNWFQHMGDPSGQSTALNGLGEALLATGHPVAARTDHAAAVELATQAGDRYEQARAQNGLASAWQASGCLCWARHHWQQALTLYAGLCAPEADQIRAQLTADWPAPNPRACACQNKPPRIG